MSERPIDNYMAALIKGMALRGDAHDEIAAFFLINQGRISEIVNSTDSGKFAGVKPTPPAELPPVWGRSPYEAWENGLPEQCFRNSMRRYF